MKYIHLIIHFSKLFPNMLVDSADVLNLIYRGTVITCPCEDVAVLMLVSKMMCTLKYIPFILSTLFKMFFFIAGVAHYSKIIEGAEDNVCFDEVSTGIVHTCLE